MEPAPVVIPIGPYVAPHAHPDAWKYAVWMFVYGLVAIGLLSFKKPLAAFVGATLAFALAAFSIVVLISGFRVFVPVHGSLTLVMFLCSLGLLFYSGYTFAVWTIESRARKTAS